MSTSGSLGSGVKFQRLFFSSAEPFSTGTGAAENKKVLRQKMETKNDFINTPDRKRRCERVGGVVF
jgi:hypothetical protein